MSKLRVPQILVEFAELGHAPTDKQPAPDRDGQGGQQRIELVTRLVLRVPALAVGIGRIVFCAARREDRRDRLAV